MQSRAQRPSIDGLAIRRELGRGEMGVVYLAPRHERASAVDGLSVVRGMPVVVDMRSLSMPPANPRGASR